MARSVHNRVPLIRSVTLFLVFMSIRPSCGRDFGWEDLLNFNHLPDLTPYELTWESGATRFDAQGQPAVRRNQKNQVILLEADGPGVLVRLYGSPGAGKMHFLTDGNPQPLVVRETGELFRWHYEMENPVMTGEPEPAQTFPFLWPVAEREMGVVSLAPIPFRRSLKVLSDEPIPENNYEFEWIRLSASPEQQDDAANLVKEVVSRWRHPGEPPKGEDDLRKVRGSLSLQPGRSAALCKIEGAGEIRSLRVTLNPPNPMLEQQLILRCWWDGKDWPSVQVPLGDLCRRKWGQGRPGVLGGAYIVPGQHRGALSLEHTLYLRFPMPFAAGARMELQLLGESYVDRLDYELAYSVTPPQPSDGRFCASFRTGEWPAGDTVSVARLQGRGKLVALGVANWDYPEGYAWDWRKDFDPVLTVDGQVRTRGNGLISPYYGGGTPLENRVQMLFPVEEPQPRAVTRHFLLDAIPFQRSLEVRLERAPGREGGCRYSSLVAWYGERGSVPDLQQWKEADLYWPTLRRLGAIEAEDLVSTAKVSEGEMNIVCDTPGRFFLSGRRMVALVPHSPRARFEFRLPVPKEGQYRVFTRSFHSISSQSLYEMEVNGVKSKHDFMGFYAKFPGIGLAQNELDDWGTFLLSSKANRLVLRPKEDYATKMAVTNFLYCVDAFLLTPVETTGVQ